MRPGDHAVMNAHYLPSAGFTPAEPVAPAEPAQPAPPGGPAAPVRWIALIAAVAFAAEMAVSARYGYVRDELYFLEAGRHLAFGYVDQPPLTPLLARLSAAVSGDSLIALRLIPALALAGMVALTATMSRLLGAGRTGQVLAALATATCAEYVGAMHELTTTAPDFFFWTLTLVLVLKLLTTGDRRWWVAIGACAGVASEAKWNIGFLVAALAVGFVLSPARRLAASRWLAVGGVIAVALALPDLLWQAANGWPAFDVFAALQQSAGHNRAVYLIAQIIYTGLVLTPVWIAGLVWTLRNPAARRFRPVGIASLIVLVLFLVMGGKPYYPGGIFTFLLAAGSVPLERWLAAPPAAGPPHPARARHGRGHGPGRPDRAARRAPGPARPHAGHRPGSEDQLRPRRGNRLAEPGRAGGPRVPRPPAGAALPHHAAHRQLRRGGRDRALRTGRRAPDGLQRQQQLLALGPATSP